MADWSVHILMVCLLRLFLRLLLLLWLLVAIFHKCDHWRSLTLNDHPLKFTLHMHPLTWLQTFILRTLHHLSIRLLHLKTILHINFIFQSTILRTSTVDISLLFKYEFIHTLVDSLILILTWLFSMNFLLLFYWSLFLLCFCLYFMFTLLLNFLCLQLFILFSPVNCIGFHIIEGFFSIRFTKIMLTFSFRQICILIGLYCLFLWFIIHDFLLFSFYCSSIKYLFSFSLGIFIFLFITIKEFHSIVEEPLISNVVFGKIFTDGIFLL